MISFSKGTGQTYRGYIYMHDIRLWNDYCQRSKQKFLSHTDEMENIKTVRASVIDGATTIVTS